MKRSTRRLLLGGTPPVNTAPPGGPGGGTGDLLLDPLTENIVLTWDGDNTNTLPVFDFSFTDVAVSDIIYLLRSTDNWATFDYETVTVTSITPVTFSPTTFGFGGAWAYANWLTRAVLERASVLTYMSNDEPAYIDITAPVVTSPLGVATGQTTADISATFSESIFTAYAVVLADGATVPSVDQVIAGTDASDVAATFADNQAYTTTGTKTLPATGLISNTAYQVHWVAVDAAGNESAAVVTSAAFTTNGTSQLLLEGGSFNLLLEGNASIINMEG